MSSENEGTQEKDSERGSVGLELRDKEGDEEESRASESEGSEWPQKPPLTLPRGALQGWDPRLSGPPPYPNPAAQNSSVSGALRSPSCSQTPRLSTAPNLPLAHKMSHRQRFQEFFGRQNGLHPFNWT